MTSLKITSVNVNGIRAAVRKGMHEWVQAAAPDVLLLQEVRAPQAIVDDLIPGTWRVAHHESSLKGRAGVAVCVHEDAPLEVTAVRLGLPQDASGEEPGVDSGRWVEMDVASAIGPVTFISAYLHSGDSASEEKMAAKYAHLERVSTRLAELAEGKSHVLMCGDFNIVHRPLDIKNWKPNHNKTAGVLDEEIAYLDRWFGELGYRDVHRDLVGEEQGPYTWWSQRGKAFDNNAGWRIDYHLASPDFAARGANAEVGRAAIHAERWSDHAPVSVTYSLT